MMERDFLFPRQSLWDGIDSTRGILFSTMHESGNTILRTLFFLVWVLALIHIAAESYYWYWTYRWLDIPMHVLGGVWLGLGALWLRHHTEYVRKLWDSLPFNDVAVALLCGLCVGLVWEGYEYIVWQYVGTGLPVQYFQDTILDVLMDTVGAFIGYIGYRALTPRVSDPTVPI